MPEIGNSSVFSQTDSSNNTSTDPGWPEGMAPSRVNDAARALQGAITRDWNWKGPTVTSGGTANAQTLTYSVAPAAYYQGQIFAFIAGATNTGACTLNVNSLGAKNVYLGNAALTGGEILSGKVYVVAYDGTQFQMVSPPNTGRGGLIGVQVFTTAGTSTYTPTAGANTYVAEVIGGGGGGGGAALTAGGQAACGGAGGAGGYARKRGLISAISGATITVGAKGTGGTAGANNGTAGGTSSIGAVVSATGGGAGTGMAAQAGTAFQVAASNGTGSSGDINSSGIQGAPSLIYTAGNGYSGMGGSSFYGTGGNTTTAGAAGNAAGGYGSGGSGANNNASQAARAGGNGTPGLVIIWEYA